MNAVDNSKSQSFTSTFTWLLKREYWEHRGGFFWAPFIIALVIVAITLVFMITADITAHQHGVNLSGLNLGQLAEKMSPENTAKFAAGLDIGLLGMSVPIAIALSFVAFFYLVGALYDDRRDRSVLFWKSLPVSDTNTVLSKVVAAVVVAPLLAVAAIIALQLAFLVLASLYAVLHGVNPLPLLWAPDHLVAMWIKLVLLIPINALWALPTVGWLLLCSSFVRSKPFLWAVLLPLLVGFVVSWVNLMQQFALPSAWYWKNIFGRIVFGIVPAGWIGAGLNPGSTIGISNVGGDINIGVSKLDFINSILSMDRLFGVLLSPQLWIGVIAGVAMIAAAIYFRQKRTEAYA
jgi:ABC-2 type transport system permease protein